MKKISTLYKKDTTNLSLVVDILDEDNKWVIDGDGIPSRKFDGTASAIIDGDIYKRFDAKLKTGKQLKRLGHYIELLEIGQQVVKTSGKKFSTDNNIATIIEFGKHPHTGEDAVIIDCGDYIDLRQLRPIGIKLDSKYYKDIPIGAIPCQEPDLITGHHPHWVKCDRDNQSDKYHFEAFDKMVYKDDTTYELCGTKINGNREKFNEHILVRHGSEVLPITDFSYNSLRDYLTINDIEGIVFKHKLDSRMCKIRKTDFGIKR